MLAKRISRFLEYVYMHFAQIILLCQTVEVFVSIPFKVYIFTLSCTYESFFRRIVSVLFFPQYFYFYFTYKNVSVPFRGLLYNNYTLPGYLRTMIEEYARLPYKKRERIYFSKKYEIIETAIQTGKQLLVTISDGRQFHVLPYSIMEDPLETTAYLTGFSYEMSADKTTKKPCSFRIATLKNNLRIEQSKNVFLTLADKSLLEEKINQNGVQFLLSDNVTVKLKLTKQGIHDFNHQLTLRPTPIDITNDIYTFQCSLLQAKFYFFKVHRAPEKYFKSNIFLNLKKNIYIYTHISVSAIMS